MPREKMVLWTGPALQDLKSIREYVSRDNPTAARSLANKIRQAVLRLAELPESGTPVPELSNLGYREVIVTPYRIVYDHKGRQVIILRVWHGRRQLAED